MKIHLASILLPALAALSCNGATAEPDVAAYKQLDQQLLTAVNRHADNSGNLADQQACQDERDRYQAEARPLADDMRRRSDGMDGCMMAMGRDDDADLGSMCDDMYGELDQHQTAACASTDPAQERAEADRHCNAMRDLLQRELDRADRMGQSGGMMSGMMSDGTCHR